MNAFAIFLKFEDQPPPFTDCGSNSLFPKGISDNICAWYLLLVWQRPIIYHALSRGNKTSLEFF